MMQVMGPQHPSDTFIARERKAPEGRQRVRAEQHVRTIARRFRPSGTSSTGGSATIIRPPPPMTRVMG